MKSIILSAAVAAAFVAVPASAQISNNRPGVADVGSGTFALVNKWNARDDDLWCWAGKAALERGASYRDRLYVVGVTSARQSQYGSETITFTFRPTQEQLAQARQGQSAIRGIGNNITINSTTRRCHREIDF